MKKPVVQVGNQMEWAFPLEIFRKKGIPSEVFLFSHFYRNYRKSLFHLIHPTSTILLHEYAGILPQNMASFAFQCPTCRFESIMQTLLLAIAVSQTRFQQEGHLYPPSDPYEHFKRRSF